jgi:hypothetical protein
MENVGFCRFVVLKLRDSCDGFPLKPSLIFEYLNEIFELGRRVCVTVGDGEPKMGNEETQSNFLSKESEKSIIRDPVMALQFDKSGSICRAIAIAFTISRLSNIISASCLNCLSGMAEEEKFKTPTVNSTLIKVMTTITSIIVNPNLTVSLFIY